MAAPTLRAARFEATRARYKRLCMGDRLELVRHRSGLWARFVAAPGSRAALRARVDAELAFVVAFARRMTGVHVEPLDGRLRAPPPRHRPPYDGVFGRVVTFGARRDEVLLAARDLERELIASRELAAAATARAEALLRTVSGGHGVRVDAVLQASVGTVLPAASELPRALGMSGRSLQRALQGEGTSLRVLLDDARNRLARYYLREEQMPIAEVSFLLGFSSSVSFFRAFRRWTGTTPEAFRRRSAPGERANVEPRPVLDRPG